jgi:endonuclease III
MVKKPKPETSASTLGINVRDSELDLFEWFLACFLFGKPIQSGVAINTWELMIENKLDTPWAIVDAKNRKLVGVLYEGKYTRYAESTARAMKQCMQQLIDWYEGSLQYMIDTSENEDMLEKRLQKLYGVGPKVAEIFMRETTEFFAERVE